jgi:hypothetical protein
LSALLTLAGAIALNLPMPAIAASSPATVRIAFIPMDDRPATEQFPQLTSAICGAQLELPPQALLGHFTKPGDPAALGRWLLDLDTRSIAALVVSADMLAYGGLVASRTPATSLADARAHLQTLVRFHEQHPSIPIYTFGTIMRLAPTETPEAEPYLDALTNYASLAGGAHLTPDDKAALAQSRGSIPDRAFWDYIGARARDLAIDEQLVTLAATGSISWLAITQDDAGAPNGLQAAEQHALDKQIASMGARDRVLLNPGADEMGMVAVTRAIEDAHAWYPKVRVVYSSPRGPELQDPLEDVPVEQTIATLERALHLRAGLSDPEYTLSVFTPLTPIEVREHYFADLASGLRTGTPTAIADLTFIDDDITEERVSFEALQAAGVADKPLAFASWNTTANSIGTVFSAASCAALAKHFDLPTTQARETFLFDRYVDDYAYRLLVRPSLNAELRDAGLDTFALGTAAGSVETEARSLLWPLAVDLYDQSFAPAWKHDQLGIYLPWQRTFEVKLDAALTRR